MSTYIRKRFGKFILIDRENTGLLRRDTDLNLAGIDAADGQSFFQARRVGEAVAGYNSGTIAKTNNRFGLNVVEIMGMSKKTNSVAVDNLLRNAVTKIYLQRIAAMADASAEHKIRCV